MGHPKSACCCGGCKVKQTDCNACRKCVPKYLCVEVVVTPGPYSAVGECCEQFGFRIPYDCGGYAGSGTCPEGVGIDIDVRLEDTAEGCTTTVTSSLLPYPLEYEGTLPTIEFEVENEDGDTLNVTIGSANVVINPESVTACAPCICAACLPAALCLLFNHYGHTPDDPELCEPGGGAVTVYERVATTASWYCGQWVVEDGELPVDPDFCPGTAKAYSLSITLLHDECAIRVQGTMGDGSVDETISLEGTLHPRKITGTECESEEALAFTLGTPQLLPGEGEDPGPQTFLSFIDVTLTFTDYMGNDVGTVRIRDQSCGQCETCEFPDETAQCCDPITGPTSVVLTCSLGSTPFTAGAPNSYGQSAAGDCFPGQSTPYSISCQFDAGPDGQDLWILNKFGDAPNVTLYGTCDPVLYLTGGGYTVTE